MKNLPENFQHNVIVKEHQIEKGGIELTEII